MGAFCKSSCKGRSGTPLEAENPLGSSAVQPNAYFLAAVSEQGRLLDFWTFPEQSDKRASTSSCKCLSEQKRPPMVSLAVTTGVAALEAQRPRNGDVFRLNFQRAGNKSRLNTCQPDSPTGAFAIPEHVFLKPRAL